MCGIDDPTAPHAPATNLPDARLNVLHVTIWYEIQLILWTKHTLTFIKKEKTRKNYLSIQSTHFYSYQCQTVWVQAKTYILSVLTGSKTVCFGYLQTTKVTAGRTIRTVWTASKLLLISKNCLSKLFASRSGSTICRSWSGFKLFA